MAQFEPRDPDFQSRIEKSFAAQPFAGYLGAELARLAAGEVEIRLPFKRELGQQHGYVHGGVLTTIADSAAGYAAMTLADPGIGVLTTELKVNFLRPAGTGLLVAKGRVIKPGRSLNIVQGDVVELRDGGEIHVLTGLMTMMFVTEADLG